MVDDRWENLYLFKTSQVVVSCVDWMWLARVVHLYPTVSMTERTDDTMTTKFEMTALDLGHHSAMVIATRNKKTVAVRFFFDAGKFQYNDTLDKISGEKLDDVSDGEKQRCHKSLMRALARRNRADKRIDRIHFGRK